MTALSQPQAALQGANQIRLARSALRQRIEAMSRSEGCLFVSDLLDDPPAVIGSLAIGRLLTWIRMVGESQARGILAHVTELPISETRRIDQLTEHQRFAIADHLYQAHVTGRLPTLLGRQREAA